MLSSMGGFEKQRLLSPCMIMPYNEHKKHDDWVIMEGDLEDTYNNNNNNNNNNISSSSSSSSTSSIENSDTSSGTLSSSDLLDDASSSSTSCSSSLQSSNGPLYELSELITQLPIKRGLSKYYQGKSQSFTSLSRVESIEDLAKKETPYSRKMKACKSYAGGLDAHKAYTLPKATISKKPSRGSLPSLSKLNRRGSFMNTTCTRLPPIPQSNSNMQC